MKPSFLRQTSSGSVALTSRNKTEILALRHGLWTHVASRKHTPIKVFFGGENELMLHGKVVYVLKASGNQVEVPWAGRVEFAFDEAGSNPKMKFYQVYLVRDPKLEITSSFIIPALRLLSWIGIPADDRIQDSAAQSGK